MNLAVDFEVRSEPHVSLAVNLEVRSEAHVSLAVDFRVKSARLDSDEGTRPVGNGGFPPL